eukprot:scaffold25574_cov74-Phaeocystis_antarctica.AAC.3
MADSDATVSSHFFIPLRDSASPHTLASALYGVNSKAPAAFSEGRHRCSMRMMPAEMSDTGADRPRMENRVFEEPLDHAECGPHWLSPRRMRRRRVQLRGRVF